MLWHSCKAERCQWMEAAQADTGNPSSFAPCKGKLHRAAEPGMGPAAFGNSRSPPATPVFNPIGFNLSSMTPTPSWGTTVGAALSIYGILPLGFH